MLKISSLMANTILADSQRLHFVLCTTMSEGIARIIEVKTLVPWNNVNLFRNLYFTPDLGPNFRYSWGKVRACGLHSSIS